ncbi:hypothetical protein [Dorea sp. AM10-31]|uniref:hypothetical protein n=1 Tax=Dorea sp. AM10-31 TaxID=2293098 RepID=UPI0013149913|nr:hypothetical protein [Dorea sp. AM10-31]
MSALLGVEFFIATVGNFSPREVTPAGSCADRLKCEQVTLVYRSKTEVLYLSRYE